MCVSSNLSKRAYLDVRKTAREKAKTEIFPSYAKVLLARKECYPSEDSMVFTDMSAKLSLQGLLDHTARRLIADLSVNAHEAHLHYKWGFDGATSQSVYKQAIREEDESAEESLFCTTLVPLQLTADGQPVWTNPAPSSTRLCRPIQIQYARETAALCREERDRVQEEISRLQSTAAVSATGAEVAVTHSMQLTMIDGKAANAVSGTKSSMVCSLCGAKPREMNDISRIITRPVQGDLQLGLSTMHAWIRAFECILHISYRLEVKVWAVTGDARKAAVRQRKKAVQERFRRQLGLVVDQPLAGGSGTSNDGNTARRAFADPEKFSAVTEVDFLLIQRLATILTALQTTEAVSSERYAEYALETARIFVDRYPWFYMPASLHRLLIHGSDVISSLLLPIGMYSEEVQESRNKHNRQFRLHHARKTSRVDTITDQFHYLLVTSDPKISKIIVEKEKKGQRRRRKTAGKHLLDISHLVQQPDINNINDNDDTDDSESDAGSDYEEEEPACVPADLNNNLLQSAYVVAEEPPRDELDGDITLPDYYGAEQ